MTATTIAPPRPQADPAGFVAPAAPDPVPTRFAPMPRNLRWRRRHPAHHARMGAAVLAVGAFLAAAAGLATGRSPQAGSTGTAATTTAGTAATAGATSPTAANSSSGASSGTSGSVAIPSGILTTAGFGSAVTTTHSS